MNLLEPIEGVRALLFDNDGVLAHTEQTWFEANQQILREMGVAYEKADFVQHTFEKSWGSTGWLERRGFDAEAIAKFSEERNSLWRSKISRLDTIEPTASSVLSELRKEYRLGVVTNTALHEFGLIHSNRSVTDLLEVHILKADYRLPKPAPDAYIAGLHKLDLPADAVLAVEDSPRGIRAAQAAGMKVIVIGNPAFPDLDVSHADYQIDRLEDLLVLVRDH